MGNFLSGKPNAAATAVVNGVELTPPAQLDAKLVPLWEQIVHELPAGLVKAPDVRLVVQLCEALYIQQECWQAISTTGVLTQDKTHADELRRHPAVLVWRQAADTARTCMNLLGMSPAARARIQVNEDAQHDPFEEFLQRRQNQPPA